MFRKHIPDLDLLDSPLISASPFSSILGVVPGSAIAERIFNDPESWEKEEDDSDIEDSKDAMTWLAEELEKYHSTGDESILSPIEREADSVTLRPFSERYKLMAKPSLIQPTPLSDVHMKWEGVMENEKPPYLPIFERSGIDLNLDLNLRLSKIWQSGGNIFRSFPSPLSSSSLPSLATKNPPTDEMIAPVAPPGIRPTVRPTLDLGSETEQGPSPVVSPVAVASASTTWSILEWYGVHPDTPRFGARRTSLLSSPYPPTPFLPVPPVPHLPASLRAPVNLPEPSVKAPPPAVDTTPIRRLPVIPDPPRNTPSPTLIPTQTLPKIKTTPDLPRNTPSPAPIPAHTLLRIKTTPDPPRNNSSRVPTLTHTPPRIKTPEHTPSSSLTRAASTPDPSSLSPYSTPNRSCSSSRSPPAGPRPRSGTLPVKSRQRSGQESPFTISPPPNRVRTIPLPSSPPPPLRLGVHCTPCGV